MLTTSKAMLQYILVGIHERRIQFKLDTGAEVNVTPINVLLQAGRPVTVKKTIPTVTTYSGENIPILGDYEALCKVRQKN